MARYVLSAQFRLVGGAGDTARGDVVPADRMGGSGGGGAQQSGYLAFLAYLNPYPAITNA